MRILVYTDKNGVFWEVFPVINTLEKITEAQAEKRVWERLPKDVINPHFVDGIDLPIEFRDAWKHHPEKGIHVDFNKAKELTKERLRRERKPLFEKLDNAHRSASRQGLSVREIEIEAKRLADITKNVDLVTTLDELKSISL